MKRHLRSLVASLCLLIALLAGNPLTAQQTLINVNGWNAYVHVPSSYNSSSASYPTIIFMPGLGEVGNNPASLIANGPGAYIAQGWNGNVTVNGTTTEFIVISLQPASAWPVESEVNQKIQRLKNLYRIDNNRMYLTGLSMGGWASSTFVTADPMGSSATYASQVAALVTVEGVTPNDNTPYPNLFDNFANSGGKLLCFEQVNDGRDGRTVVNRMNATKPNSAIFVSTNFGGGGHCCWNQFYGGQGTQPGVFSLGGNNENLYQWLARQSRGVTATTAPNQAPTANAGADKTITLPTNTTTLTGSGTDTDGTIASYAWTKVSGPSAGTISSPAAATTNVTALAQGTYTFRLTVTDNSGATKSDDVIVTVNAAPVANQAPVANAGADQVMTLPINTASLSGSATDADGTIVSYSWTRVSGPSSGIIGLITSAITNLSSLIQGTYVYRLTVTDNQGATATDDVTITVNPAVASAPSQPGCNPNAPVTYILNPTGSGEIWIPDASTRPWKGGDTLKIPAGNYSVIEISKFKGDACKKIVITNMNGQVVTPVLRFKNDASYFKLTGTGKAGVEYGFKVQNGALAFNLVHDVEADHIEMTGGNLGIYCKTDPVESDPRTLFVNGSSSNYTMSNIYFHHNYVHDVSGEGMYIGHSSPSNGGTSSTGAVMMPLRMENIEIAYNRVENTDWDGIQLSNARGNAKIHDNTVRNFGRINLSSQQAGIILGGNTQGDIYNNTVSKGTGNGIEVFGYGLNKLYGNTIDSTGWDGSSLGQESVFLNDLKTSPEANPKQQIYFYNNAIRNPKTKGAVRVSNYQSNSLAASVYDNTYCIPNAPANWQNIYVLINAPGSTVTNQTLSCGVAPTSPTVPPVANVAPTANAGADQVITLPTSGVTLNGSGTDTDGTISSYSWTKVSGPAATITTASAASTTITGLVQGVYEFKLTVADNAGATGSDNVIITVNSPANATPTANAGSTQTITLPTSSVTLNGSGTDSDGSIVSYQWTKTTGGNATITNAAAASTTVTGLAQGVYTFQLKVTDNAGATATANVAVTVNSAPVATGKVIRVNLFGGSNPYNDTKWNNWNTSGGLNSAKFLYEDRSLSNVSASLEAQALVADNGANYASGATVAPQGVFRYVSANTSIRNLSIKGLTPGKKYSFEFYASRATTGNATEYSIGSKKDTIKTDNNIADYAKFTNITADGAGNVTVLLTKIGVWNYISGFSIFEEGSPAAAFAPDPFESIEPAKSNEVTFGETLYEESTSSVSAYPNPFVGSFNVSINSRSAGLYSLVLLTTNGQRVYYKEVSKPIGTLTESINVRSLPAGTYVLQIISKATGNKTVHRVVKGE